MADPQIARDVEMLKRKLRKQEAQAFLPPPQAQTFTPTWTATSSNPAIGTGTLTGRYVQAGKLIIFEIQMVAGNTTTFGTGNWEFSLPVAMTTDFTEGWGSAAMTDLNTAIYLGHTRLLPSTTRCRVMYTVSGGATAAYATASAPFAWATGDFISINGSYIAA